MTSGEFYLLAWPRGKKTSKYDIPLDNLLCLEPVLVRACVAESRCLPTTGPRSVLGTILPARNCPWLNAAQRALIAFTGSNNDIKFPQRLPILPETHEVLTFDIQRSQACHFGDIAGQMRDMQGFMAQAAGYFGGYTAKMQDIGARNSKIECHAEPQSRSREQG